MKKYNHAYTVAFSIDTDHEPDDVKEQELIDGIERRIRDLKHSQEIQEAVGLPFDTIENEPVYSNPTRNDHKSWIKLLWEVVHEWSGDKGDPSNDWQDEIDNVKTVMHWIEEELQVKTNTH